MSEAPALFAPLDHGNYGTRNEEMLASSDVSDRKSEPIQERSSSAITVENFRELLTQSGNNLSNLLIAEVDTWLDKEPASAGSEVKEGIITDTKERAHHELLDASIKSKVEEEMHSLSSRYENLKESLQKDIIASLKDISEHGTAAHINIPEWPAMELEARSSLALPNVQEQSFDRSTHRKILPDNFAQETSSEVLGSDAVEAAFCDALSSSSTHFQSAFDICKVLAVREKTPQRFSSLDTIDSEDEDDADQLDVQDLEAESDLMGATSKTPTYGKKSGTTVSEFVDACSEDLMFAETKDDSDDDTRIKTWRTSLLRHWRLITFFLIAAIVLQFCLSRRTKTVVYPYDGELVATKEA